MNVQRTARMKVPFGIAQIGKAFRNEIMPKSGLIRQREFLMAEIEHFLDPNLKYKKYDKFKSVENLEVFIFDEINQQNNNDVYSKPIKITLRNAIDQVFILYKYIVKIGWSI